MTTSAPALYCATNRHGVTIRLAVLGEADRNLLVQFDLEEDEDIREMYSDAIHYAPVESSQEGLSNLLDLDEDDWDAELLTRALDLDWVPQWWVGAEGCQHTQACSCGPVSLADALTHLSGQQRSGALTAQLQLLSLLSTHHSAATALASGEVSGNLCVGCLTEVDTHLEALEEALVAAGKALGDAVAHGEPLVRLTRRKDAPVTS